MTSSEILDCLDSIFPDARCELNYSKDYELLIAVVLSAQCTDARVNQVTKDLFDKYDIFSLAKATSSEIEEIIKPVGTHRRKSVYLIEIAKRLVSEYNGVVPNNREFLESLPGVGHKSANVVLSNIYDIPAIAVDTHVTRVSKRLALAKETDNVIKIEQKLMKFFPKEKWSRVHHQLVLFGRYICKSQHPLCDECPIREKCPYIKKINYK